jgi:hypothetical protein
MNDFSEIENKLRKLRPVQPSADLVSRIERALADTENCRASVSDAVSRWRWLWRFTETPYKIPLGLGLAAAAALVLFARIQLDRPVKKTPTLAAITPAPAFSSTSSAAQFVPAGLTQVVYHTRDEGLHFPNNSEQPMRRVRSQSRETLRWRNPTTGASLRISYPSEEVLLVPVTGQ